MDTLHYPLLFTIPALPGWSAYAYRKKGEAFKLGEIPVDDGDGKNEVNVFRFEIGGWGVDLPREQREITLPGAIPSFLPPGGFFGGSVDEFKLVPLDLSGGRLDGERLIMISPPGETVEQGMTRIHAAEKKAGRR